MDLSNKVVLVTGAGIGIGKGIALHLAACGADVIVNYRSSEKQALEVVEQIQAMGRKAIAIKADISSVKEINAMIEQAKEAFGTIHVLVNNSAYCPTIDFFDVTEESWDEVLDTNLKGSFFTAQACAREMVKHGGGKIINISSVHALLTMTKYAAYASSKGGMNALTRQLALDLAHLNIQVNAVSPGATEVEKNLAHPLHDSLAVGKQIPAGRIGMPKDVATVVAFFASSASDFVTGQVLTVDGGSSTQFYLKSVD
ncbi:glucose 1-dehydrogenase [Paenibacillus psychroresistens]|uniref:Glucose 1-dehydrogenase n=1 Tax=Paenibacillus psychroresistens TaxID=1778678 RepID=A0A6B8RCV2_9BACL|nr:glucose 1-dehydrogenase [Paenibacillus psychroresistens]QGQ94291.1 glucose 1-dehydrogenase [Paenibacillus psychroresistens]